MIIKTQQEDLKLEVYGAVICIEDDECSLVELNKEQAMKLAAHLIAWSSK